MPEIDTVLAARDVAVAASSTASTAAKSAAGDAAAALGHAQDAATDAGQASASETNAATSASTATTQAGIATTKAGEAATSETNAAASAATATTKANDATTQAGIATTKANEASTSATNAQGYAQQAAGSVSLVAWAPATVYAAGDVRQAPDGTAISRLGNGTSRASFDATEEAAWTSVLAKSGTLAQRDLSATFARKVSLVVAASGGDYTTLAAAIAASPAGGADILVKRGTYTISSGNINPPAGTTIRGEGEGTIIRAANALNTSVFEIQNADVTIRDLVVDGNRTNQSSNSNAIKTLGVRTNVLNCHVKNANGYNIVGFTGAEDFRVIGCTTEGARDEGIECMGVHRATIADNIVRNIGKNGIYVWGNTAQGGTCYDITITGNVVEGSSALSSGYAGIRVDDGAHSVTVAGNAVRGGGANAPGIVVASSTATAVYDVTVDANTVAATPSFGIDLAGSQIACAGNAVTGATTVGIRSSAARSTIANNVVTGVTGSGIQVSTNSVDFALLGNQVYNCTTQGIFLTTASRGSIADNVVNSCGVSSGSDAISINAAADVTIRGNVTNASGGHGLYVVTSTGVSIVGNSCSGHRASGIMLRNTTDFSVTTNVCRNNGQNGTDTNFGNGITLYNVSGTVDRGVVANNRCFDDQGTKTQDYGIRTHNTIGPSVSIGPNILDGNLASGMVFSSAGATGPSCVPWKLLSNISVSSTGNSIPHGLPYTPQTVMVYMRSAGTIWRGGGSDGTNVVLISDSGTRTCDLLVG